MRVLIYNTLRAANVLNEVQQSADFLSVRRQLSWMSWNCVPTHPRHQPVTTWVNTTRYCKCSQVFLMMGENFAQNM